MAKEFDIYLRQRLVECDLLVYSIAYHANISVTNRLILEAALNSYVLYKFAALQMGSELTAYSDTFKNSLLSLQSALTPKTTVTQVNQVDFISVDKPMVIGSDLQNLCHKLTLDAIATVEIVALVLGTEIRHSLGIWHSSATLDTKETGALAQKFITVQTIASIVQEVTEKFIKVLYPDDNVTIVETTSLNINMKRYRLLSELDGLTLADIDDITLDELDYVVLT